MALRHFKIDWETIEAVFYVMSPKSCEEKKYYGWSEKKIERALGFFYAKIRTRLI